MIGPADGFILKRWERRGPSVWNRLVGDTIIAAGKGWRNRFLGNRENLRLMRNEVRRVSCLRGQQTQRCLAAKACHPLAPSLRQTTPGAYATRLAKTRPNPIVRGYGRYGLRSALQRICRLGFPA
jgi:hypothetical protein